MRKGAISRAGADTALLALALIFAFGGLASAAGLLLPPTPESSPRAMGTAGAVGLACSAGLAWTATRRWLARWHVLLVHTSLVVCAVLTTSFMLFARTGSGEVLIGYNCVYLAMVAAYFLPARAARMHAAAIVCCLLAASSLSAVTDNRYIGPVLSASVVAVSEVLGRLVGRLRDSATIDDLTGALNRAALREVSRQVLADAARHGQSVSLVVADLDDFKTINDRDGHAAGDAILAAVVKAWRSTLRGSDVLARIGGDEFVALLPGTDRMQAAAAIARMREAHPAAWSAGVATGPPGADLAELFDEADLDLYRNKSRRRASMAG